MTVPSGGWVRLAGAAVAALAAASACVGGPVTVVTAASTRTPAEPAGPVAGALIRAFEAARHMPGSAVGGIRAGSLHVASSAGTRWALASFIPAAKASQRLTAGFQDGAATGVFSEPGRDDAGGRRHAGGGRRDHVADPATGG